MVFDLTIKGVSLSDLPKAVKFVSSVLTLDYPFSFWNYKCNLFYHEEYTPRHQTNKMRLT